MNMAKTLSNVLFIMFCFITFGCSVDPRANNNDDKDGNDGAGGQELTCVDEFWGADCSTNCSPECGGDLVCVLGALELAEDAEGLCVDGSGGEGGSSSSSTSSSSSSSSSGEASSSSTSSSGETPSGKSCSVMLVWEPTDWTPASDAKVYVTGEYTGPEGPKGSWDVPGICQMTKDSNGSKRSCVVDVMDGTVMMFTGRIDNPAGKYGVSWFFDKGNYPGGGDGDQVGKTYVAGSLVEDGDLVSNGFANTYNAAVTIDCD